MKDPRLSVLMCVYNAAEFLRQSIDSVLNQTFTDFELLIGEDGSTDDSFKIISEYEDPRIRIFRNSQNRGIVYTCNQLIRESRGEYLGRHDSDDISRPQRFQKQMDFFEKHPDITVCGTNVKVFGEKKQTKFYPQSNEEIKAYMILNNPFCTSTVIFKKPENDLFFRNSLEPSEDYGFFFELSKFCQIANLSEHLLNYRWHANNVSTQRKDKMAETADQIRLEILSQTLNYQIKEREVLVLNQISDRNATSPEDLMIFEALAIKLLKKNEEVKYYNQRTIQNLFFHQWLTNCLRIKDTTITKRIKTCVTSELFNQRSLINFISWRNFRSFSNALFQL